MTAADDRPTPTSTALVVAATVATAAALAGAADVTGPALVGALGAVTAALLVAAAGWEHHRTAGTLLASVLVVPVGLGLVATTLGTVLVLAESLFPVPVAAEVPPTAIHLSARAAVVVGASTAVFGAAVTTRGALDVRAVRRAATTSLRTALVPFLLGGLFATQAALAYVATTASGPGPGRFLGEVVRVVTRVFFRPEASGPHLPTFVLFAGVALLAVQRGLRALPLTELVPDAPGWRERRRAIERVDRGLFRAGVALLAAFPVATVVQIVAPPDRLRALLGAGLYGLLAAVTTAPGLRALAWWATVLGLGVAALVWLLRRFAQTAADRIGSGLAPFAGGALITAWGLLAADAVLAATVQWVADKLPGVYEAQFTATAAAVVDVYGAETVVVGALAGAGVLATIAVAGLWTVVATDYVAERTAGAAIASLSLFNAAAVAAVADASHLLVLGALVAAVLVWDAGEFGTTLGREVGRRASTRRVELVHATGTLAVGGVGAAAALLIADRAVGAVSVATGPAALGLVVGVVGLVALVVALR